MRRYRAFSRRIARGPTTLNPISRPAARRPSAACAHLRKSAVEGVQARTLRITSMRGAVLGIVLGFGMPKVFRRIVTWGVPLALVAVTIKNATRSETPV